MSDRAKFNVGDRVRDLTGFAYGEGVVSMTGVEFFGSILNQVLLDDGDYALYFDHELELVSNEGGDNNDD